MNDNIIGALDLLDEKLIEEALLADRLENKTALYLRNAALGLGAAAAVAAVGVGISRLNADKGISIVQTGEQTSASGSLNELLAATSGESSDASSEVESQAMFSPETIQLIPVDTEFMGSVYLGDSEPYIVTANSERVIFSAGNSGLFVLYYGDNNDPSKPSGITYTANIPFSFKAAFAGFLDDFRFVGKEDGSVECYATYTLNTGALHEFILRYRVNIDENRLEYLGTADEIPESFNVHSIDNSVITDAASPNAAWINDTTFVYLAAHTGGYRTLDRKMWDVLGFTHSQLRDLRVAVFDSERMWVAGTLVPFTQELTYDSYMQYRLANNIHENTEQAEREKAWAEAVDCSGFGLPLDEKYVTSTDCYRTILSISEEETVFVPLRAEADQPVYASQDGEIIYSEFNALQGEGQMIVIEHENGLRTIYRGLDKRDEKQTVNVGDTVKKGDIIGYTGVFGYMDEYGVYVQICTAEESAEIIPESSVFDVKDEYIPILDTSDYAQPFTSELGESFPNCWDRQVINGEITDNLNILPLDAGAAINAAQDGEVVFAGYYGTYMNLIRIKHADGNETWYSMVDDMLVKAGDTVTKGQQIASVGYTPLGEQAVAVQAFTAEEAEARFAKYAFAD